jgi:hypothetical protein
MSEFQPKQINLEEINEGKKYKKGDGVQPSTINALIEGVAFSGSGQGGGSQLDIQIDGQSIVQDGVANIPLANKLDKVITTSSYRRVYGINEDGNQVMFLLTGVATGRGTIPLRDADNGCIQVGTPTADTHTANKKYVDANKGTKFYKHEIVSANYGAGSYLGVILITDGKISFVEDGVLKDMSTSYIGEHFLGGFSFDYKRVLSIGQNNELVNIATVVKGDGSISTVSLTSLIMDYGTGAVIESITPL